MPSTDDMKKRQEARELRKAQRDGHVERAHTEAAAQSVKSQANEQARAERVAAGQAREGDSPVAVRKEPTRVVSRKEKQAIAKRSAERQADVDMKRAPEPVDVEAEVNKWDGTGQPPLHILNAVAEKIDANLRDEGKEIAQAAAKGAYDTYVGKIGGGQRNRHARMRAQIAAGEAKLATKKD